MIKKFRKNRPHRVRWLTIAAILATSSFAPALYAAEKNELANADFSQLDATGQPLQWSFGKVDGNPTCRVVNDGEGSRIVIDLAQGDGARLVQGLKHLPKERYYAFSGEYRLTSKGTMLPNLAVRLSADTKKGLWRIWDYSQPKEGVWQTMQLDFIVPSDMTGKGVGLTYFINDNRMPGTIEVRNVKVVELPLTDYQKQHAYITAEGTLYYPRQTQPTAPNPALPPSVTGKPLFWWTGQDADGVLNSEALNAKQVNRPLDLPVAAGGDNASVFVLEANRPLNQISLRLKGVPGDMTAQLQRVDLWRQRMGYRGGFYDFLPERVLDLPSAVDLAAGERYQLFLHLAANEKVKPGASHKLSVAVVQEGKEIFEVPVAVKVQPFALPADAPQPTWGLYPDPGRWANMTPEAMNRELKWLHDSGIRTLLLYMPLRSIAASKPINEQNLDQALAAWRTALHGWGDQYMDRFIKAGFGPLWVCNVQSLPQYVADATGLKKMGEEDRGQYSPQLLAYIEKFLAVIEEVRKERNWPEFYYHLVDEPGGGTNQAAIAEYSVLRKLKVKGFTTANQAAVVRDFREDISIFNVSNVVYTGPSELKHVQDWLAEYPHAQQWWYGAAGAYSGQDGVMHQNRYGMGFYTWLTGAKGAFLWTYQRISGSAFDDFDGAAKDAAMTYPPEDEAERRAGKIVSTLQWEGMRAGMTDYRYLQLLDQLLENAERRGHTARTRKIAGEVEALRATIWKDPLGYSFSNRTLDSWRQQVAGWITQLQQPG